MATSPLPSRGPDGKGRSIWLHHPFLLRVHMVGRHKYGYMIPCIDNPCLLGVPLVGRHQSGYKTPAFSESPWCGDINMATSPCLLGVPMVRRDQYGYFIPAFSESPWCGDINMATSPLPSRGPHGAERSIWLLYPCLLGVPMVGRHQSGYITPTFSGSPWCGEINLATKPLPSRSPHGAETSIWLHHPAFLGSPWCGEINMATSSPPSRSPHGAETSIWLHHPCLLGVPMVRRDQYGYFIPAFLESPWWGDINLATSPLPSRGPHGAERSIWLQNPCLLGVPMVRRHQYGYITLPSRGPHGAERSIWLLHPCLLGVPMVGRHQSGYITPAFSGSPWCGESNMATSPLPPWGPCWGEINMATSPLPSWGPHGVERSIWLQNHPCLLGPHGGERSIWLLHCPLLRLAMVGRHQYGYITHAFLGSAW